MQWIFPSAPVTLLIRRQQRLSTGLMVRSHTQSPIAAETLPRKLVHWWERLATITPRVKVLSVFFFNNYHKIKIALFILEMNLLMEQVSIFFIIDVDRHHFSWTSLMSDFTNILFAVIANRKLVFKLQGEVFLPCLCFLFSSWALGVKMLYSSLKEISTYSSLLVSGLAN